MPTDGCVEVLWLVFSEVYVTVPTDGCVGVLWLVFSEV